MNLIPGVYVYVGLHWYDSVCVCVLNFGMGLSLVYVTQYPCPLLQSYFIFSNSCHINGHIF